MEEDSGFSLNIKSCSSSNVGGNNNGVRRKKVSKFRQKKRQRIQQRKKGYDDVDISTKVQLVHHSKVTRKKMPEDNENRLDSADGIKAEAFVSKETRPERDALQMFSENGDTDVEELTRVQQKTKKSNEVVNQSSMEAADFEKEANKQPVSRHGTMLVNTCNEQQKNEPISTKLFGSRKNPNKELIIKRSVEACLQHAPSNMVYNQPIQSNQSQRIFTVSTFSDLHIDAKLVSTLEKSKEDGGQFGFKCPTNVQAKTVPMVLNGRDVLIKSETGSGKTLAFLLPVVEKLLLQTPQISRTDGTVALVLAPTRELCQQIYETLRFLCSCCQFLVPGIVSGGEKRKSEKARLRKGIPFLVATPGRLLDHLQNTCSFEYKALRYLILDEADRLLDLGFEKQLTQIIELLNAKKQPFIARQTILASATITKAVERLASFTLSDPVFVDSDKDLSETALSEFNESAMQMQEGKAYATPHQLVQHYIVVPAKMRLPTLSCFLRGEFKKNTHCKLIVFLSTCDSVDFHYELFSKSSWPNSSQGHGRTGEDNDKAGDNSFTSSSASSMHFFGSHAPCFRLHGSISQTERSSTFKAFKEANGGILLCTDVAARGLNLPSVEWIVQYDPPSETKDYVHRIGRTARCGSKGHSLLFVLPSEQEYLKYLATYQLDLKALNHENIITGSTRKGEFMRSSSTKSPVDAIVGDLQYRYEQLVANQPSLFEKSCLAFHSFLRSYATHSSDTKHIFHVRGLHFGHIGKSFGLRETPKSSIIQKSSKSANTGTMKKRQITHEDHQQEKNKKQKKQQIQQRRYTQNISEFAEQ